MCCLYFSAVKADEALDNRWKTDYISFCSNKILLVCGVLWFNEQHWGDSFDGVAHQKQITAFEFTVLSDSCGNCSHVSNSSITFFCHNGSLCLIFCRNNCKYFKSILCFFLVFIFLLFCTVSLCPPRAVLMFLMSGSSSCSCTVSFSGVWLSSQTGNFAVFRKRPVTFPSARPL